MKATQALHNLGQSIWLDNITRDLLDSGEEEARIGIALTSVVGGCILRFPQTRGLPTEVWKADSNRYPSATTLRPASDSGATHPPRISHLLRPQCEVLD